MNCWSDNVILITLVGVGIGFFLRVLDERREK